MKPKMDLVVLAGVIFLFLGIVAIMVGSAKDSSVKVGVGGFIGPIPFGFANSPIMLYVVIGLMAFSLIAWYLFTHLN